MTTIYRCKRATCIFWDEEWSKCSLDEISLDGLGRCEEYEMREDD